VHVDGNVQDARSALIRFEEMDKSMAKIIADRCRRPIEDVLAMMREDTYFNVHDALSNGLIDAVAD
jgi:ATP-dependent protease ClpP protease subunit